MISKEKALDFFNICVGYVKSNPKPFFKSFHGESFEDNFRSMFITELMDGGTSEADSVTAWNWIESEALRVINDIDVEQLKASINYEQLGIPRSKIPRY